MNKMSLMAALLCAFGSCLMAATDDPPPDPDAVLEQAQTLASEGKYEEALQKHIWYHENALKYKPALVGVRLSFALSYWISLGERYPKARQALVDIRDKNAAEIDEGKGTFSLFHDITSINKYLEQDSKTTALFKKIHEKNPGLAKQCYPLAEEQLAAEREYALCSGYILDPLQSFDRIKQIREVTLRGGANRPPELIDFVEKRFVEATCRLIVILNGAGRAEDAEKVRYQALTVRDDQALKDAIEKAMRPGKD